jgi:uncharacterized protein (TIGR02594 family)
MIIDMSKLLQIAMSQIGTKEIKGREHNKTIVSYAHEIGLKWINDDETPWCAIFVNWCLKKAGLPYLKSALARDGIKLGISIDDYQVRPGDIVVFWRGDRNGTKGHEAIFLGFDKEGEHIFCIGGNQGNEVSIAKYNKHHLLEFRRLEQIDAEVLPNPVLQFGYQGSEVGKLQDLLNNFGYPVGKADGVFGNKTRVAILQFQKDNKLPVHNGVYAAGTYDCFLSKLQE